MNAKRTVLKRFTFTRSTLIIVTLAESPWLFRRLILILILILVLVPI